MSLGWNAKGAAGVEAPFLRIGEILHQSGNRRDRLVSRRYRGCGTPPDWIGCFVGTTTANSWGNCHDGVLGVAGVLVFWQ